MLYTRTPHLHYIVPYECMCPPIMWLRIMLLGICTMNLAWTYVVKVAVAQISKTRNQTFLAVALIRTTYPLSSSLGPGPCTEKLPTLASSGVSRMSQRDFWSSTRGGPPSQPVGRKCCKTTSEAAQKSVPNSHVRTYMIIYILVDLLCVIHTHEHTTLTYKVLYTIA